MQKRQQVEGCGLKDQSLKEEESVDQECIATLPEFPIIDWSNSFKPFLTLSNPGIQR